MYESFYGLKDKPFHLTPDPTFFFASKLHTRALSYLKYGIGQGEGFIVITGAIGTGKTTIANSLLSDLDQQNVKAIQIVTPKLNPDDLITVTAAKLGLVTENRSKGELLQGIEKELTQLVNSNQRALLIVDEAQNLPLESVEELRMLSNFQVNGKPLLQSFLLGQPELRDLLQLPSMEQFRQRIVASCDLKPLNAIETHEYIEFRVNAAAGKELKLFSDEAIEAIYHFTTGIPRRINTVCDRILLYGFLEEKNYLTEVEAKTVIDEIVEESVEQAQPSVPTQSASNNKDEVKESRSSQKELDISKETLLEDLAPPQSNSAKGNYQVPPDVTQDITHLRNMIQEIRATLETSIEYKLKVSRYIDNAINRKLKQLKQLASVEMEEGSQKADSDITDEDVTAKD
ncbi:general secretion pathway protein A [Catenovulum agarivorans DS-2]|uniref:General secretion pathway protein A n=1 Tax=Catenovulum agarivorans DS-2 TaxID=1328313 RepID=W7QTD6_9ALTE|nr:XrtA/PEP-CTERM system-associated ATPase [Catenovulum agarivorans]EWH11118.1 general secretion pathway protein A [Catenovulum agarivorans DS-2]